MSLPNELLHTIVEFLAYTPPLPGPQSEGLHRRVSPELVALSVLNRRTRRICSPLLFAYIQIKKRRDAAHLKDRPTNVLQQFTRTLSIDYIYHRPEEGEQLLCQIVPQLKRLTHVQLCGCNARTTLLAAALAHPTVIAVLVNELPHESLYESDLSKVILEETWMCDTLSQNVERCMDQGMGLKCLEILEPELLDVDFGYKHFKGLEQIRVSTGLKHICFSWLSRLSASHPSLNELLLQDGRNFYFKRHTPPFISSFVEETRRQGLDEEFSIKCVSLRRIIDQGSEDWHVIGLSITTTFGSSSSLVELLTLISSSFPKLESLTLNAEYHKTSYRVDDLVSTFARFPSLRVLYLHRFRKRLAFGSGTERCMPSVQDFESAGFEELISRAENRLLSFTSLLVKQVRSLDSIYIEDMGYEHEKTGHGRLWRSRGWLRVYNGERKLIGGVGRTRICP
ncbi:hypothetical protein F5878DRAFT_667742 [Lentinula raphanica]|uniref:Uncharacterized protein n=1 Tax=Lentinula raphanica TaxID=153919 RepID=A0AA38NV91_9AGAR|nr:hypothetical protein F5878DRAFT_667742 [Lentinula raphanica]